MKSQETSASAGKRELTVPSQGLAAKGETKSAAPAPAGQAKAAVSAERDERSASITINVKDLDAVEKKIEKAVTQLGGRIIAKEPFENKRTVTAAIDSNKVKKLMERLKPAGDVKEKETPFVSRDGGIEIRIELNKI
jgi:hypothetical protein